MEASCDCNEDCKIKLRCLSMFLLSMAIESHPVALRNHMYHFIATVSLHGLHSHTEAVLLHEKGGVIILRVGAVNCHGLFAIFCCSSMLCCQGSLAVFAR